MNPIMLTPHELVLLFLGMCGGIITIYKVVCIFIDIFNKSKAPELKQNQELAKLDLRLSKLEREFEKVESRIHNLENGNEVTQEAILALLNHALTNDNSEGLKTAKKKLESYLISRGISS